MGPLALPGDEPRNAQLVELLSTAYRGDVGRKGGNFGLYRHGPPDVGPDKASQCKLLATGPERRIFEIQRLRVITITFNLDS
jgi:hypothetical protein